MAFLATEVVLIEQKNLTKLNSMFTVLLKPYEEEKVTLATEAEKNFHTCLHSLNLLEL